MTHTLTSPTADPHAPVASLHDLVDRVRSLVPIAVRRQLWTLFLDDDDVQLPMVVPLDGIPDRPDRVALEHWGDALDDVSAEFGVSSVVFVLERPGSREPSSSDVVWCEALVALARRRRYAVRAVLACATDGLVVLADTRAAAASTTAPTSAGVDPAGSAQPSAPPAQPASRGGTDPAGGRRPQSSPRRLRLSEVLAVR